MHAIKTVERDWMACIRSQRNHPEESGIGRRTCRTGERSRRIPFLRERGRTEGFSSETL